MEESGKKYFIEDGKIFLHPTLGQEVRPIGELIEDEASTVAYFEERFAKLEEEVNQLQQTIQENENKGSFLMKIVHLRKVLPTYNAIGDFEALDHRLKSIEDELEKGIQLNRQKNLEIKRALIFELKEIIETKNWSDTLDSVKTLQQNWIKTGRVPQENEDEINDQYQDLIDLYFEHRKEYVKERQELKELRTQQYQTLIETASTLKKLPPEKRGARIRELKEEWKNVGNVPKPVYEELLKSFREKLDILKPGKEKGRKTISPEEKQQVLAEKEAIIEEMKTLRNVSVHDMEKGVSTAKKKWKTTGFLPKEEHQKTKASFGEELDFLKEFIFIKQLAHKKIKDIEELSESAKNKHYVRFAKNLIKRDEDTLASFMENADKLTILDESSDFNQSLQLRMEGLKSKLHAKKLIISYLNKKSKEEA